MSEREGVGSGTLIVAHEWLSEQRDRNGGIEKRLFVDCILGRFDDISRNQMYSVLEFFEKIGVIYEKDSKIYLNYPYDKVKKRYLNQSEYDHSEYIKARDKYLKVQKKSQKK